MPKTDIYIDKEEVMNDEIEMMRCSVVNSLIERRDTIVVCSVAAIYGLGDPDEYGNLVFSLKVGEKIDVLQLCRKLNTSKYKRKSLELNPGNFKLKGEVF